MALISSSRNELIEHIHGLIKQNSGKIKCADLDMIIGNKQDVRYAISRLTFTGRIKRVRGFGEVGIEYFYKDIAGHPQKPKVEAPPTF